MGKLVIILAFALGALLMLESVGASNDCDDKKGYICIIQMVTSKAGEPLYGPWYKIRGKSDAKCLQGLQTGNPYKLRLVKVYHVKNCKAAEHVVNNKFMERYEKGRGGTQWYNIPLSVWATVMYKNIEDTLKTQKFLIKEVYIPVPIAPSPPEVPLESARLIE